MLVFATMDDSLKYLNWQPIPENSLDSEMESIHPYPNQTHDFPMTEMIEWTHPIQRQIKEFFSNE